MGKFDRGDSLDLVPGIRIFQGQVDLDRKIVTDDGMVLCYCDGTSREVRSCLLAQGDKKVLDLHSRAVMACSNRGIGRLNILIKGLS